MNKVHLLGNLCKENEVRYTTDNRAVLSNSLGIKREYKNKNNEYESDFVNIVVYGERAELLNKYTKKGSKILVHGRIQSRTYEDKDKQKKYVTEVVVDGIEFIQPLEKKEEKTNAQVLHEVVKNDTANDDPFAEFGEAHQDFELPFE